MKVLRELRILDFDIECRPLSWYGGDYVTKEPTAIAVSWIGEPGVASFCLDENNSLFELLQFFRYYYDEADMVTGHFIRGFDLPVLNGSFMEMGLEPLSSKLTHDTKLDMLKRSGMSNSQENLGAELGIEAPKVGMTAAAWRSANRLEPEGVALARERVKGDVIQHKEMRREMIKRGWLGPPKVWSPKPTASTRYHA
jgi:hypothetical protein